MAGNKKIAGTLLVIAILAAVTTFFWIMQQQNRAVYLANEAARQTEIAKQKRLENRPPILDLTAKQAGAWALNNLHISKFSTLKTGSTADYYALNVTLTEGHEFARLLQQFYNRPTSLIMVTAEIVRAQNGPSTTPILLFKSSGSQAPTFELLYQAKGQVLPFQNSPSGGANDIALDIHFLSNTISAPDFSKLLSITKQSAHWPAERFYKPQNNAGDLAALLKKYRVKYYDNLMQLHVGPEPGTLSGRKIALKNSAASIEISLLTKPAQFVTIDAAGAATVKTAKIQQFLRQANTANKTLQVNFWLNEGDGFAGTCRELNSALSDPGGLSTTDSAVVLWSLIHRHAWFAKDIDYQTDCLNQAQSAALQKLNLTLPNSKNSPRALPRNFSMNTVLANFVKVLRNDDPETSKAVLEAMIAAQTTLLDRAGIWLFGDNVKQNDRGRILEFAPKKAAIEQLFALPVSHFGCFSRGSGLKGQHRKTLAQFGGSPELWELEFAFNGKGKIAGITLNEADTETICRAIGNRKNGKNTCYFARRAKQFPLIANAKCGG